MEKKFSYNKSEKLKSKKLLNQVFEKGKSITVSPVKLLYIFTDEQDNCIKAGVGVSSRHFKKSVERNRIKRLLREAYRIEKQPLHTVLLNNKKKLALFLLYVDKEMPTFNLVKEKMRLCIHSLMR